VNPKYRILIPVALAVAAAAVNFVLLKRATATAAVIVLTRDVPAGRPIEPADLTVAQVRADKEVFQSAYPAADIKSLTGSAFRRDGKKGELVVTFDIDTNQQTWELRPGERDSSLVVAELPEGLLANDAVAFVMPSGEQFGPFRFLGFKTMPSRAGREPLTRVSFAGADLKPVTDWKAANPDPTRTAYGTQMQRVGGGRATPTGNKVASR
jgi:hypothetical protein